MDKKAKRSRPAAAPPRKRMTPRRKRIPYRKPELERKDDVVPFAPETDLFPAPGRPKG